MPYAIVGTAVSIRLADASPIVVRASVWTDVPPVVVVLIDEMGNALARLQTGNLLINASDRLPDADATPAPLVQVDGQFAVGATRRLIFANRSIRSLQMAGGEAIFDRMVLQLPEAATFTLFFYNVYNPLQVAQLTLIVVPGSPSGLRMANLSSSIAIWRVPVHSSGVLDPYPVVYCADPAGNIVTDPTLLPPLLVAEYFSAVSINETEIELRRLTVEAYVTRNYYTFVGLTIRGIFGKHFTLKFSSPKQAPPIVGFETPVLTLERCVPGQEYGVAGTARCASCPRFAACDGTDMLVADPGHWRANNDTLTFYPCVPRSGCAMGGVCSRGYMGPRCSTCIAGYGKSNKECAVCPEPWQSWLVLTLITLCFVCFGSLLAIRAILAAGNPEVKKNVRLVVMKMTFTHFQVVSALVTLVDADALPLFMSQFFSTSSQTAISLDFVFLSCAWSPDAYALFRLIVLSPIVIYGFILIPTIGRGILKYLAAEKAEAERVQAVQAKIAAAFASKSGGETSQDPTRRRSSAIDLAPMTDEELAAYRNDAFGDISSDESECGDVEVMPIQSRRNKSMVTIRDLDDVNAMPPGRKLSDDSPAVRRESRRSVKPALASEDDEDGPSRWKSRLLSENQRSMLRQLQSHLDADTTETSALERTPMAMKIDDHETEEPAEDMVDDGGAFASEVDPHSIHEGPKGSVANISPKRRSRIALVEDGTAAAMERSPLQNPLARQKTRERLVSLLNPLTVPKDDLGHVSEPQTEEEGGDEEMPSLSPAGRQKVQNPLAGPSIRRHGARQMSLAFDAAPPPSTGTRRAQPAANPEITKGRHKSMARLAFGEAEPMTATPSDEYDIDYTQDGAQWVEESLEAPEQPQDRLHSRGGQATAAPDVSKRLAPAHSFVGSPHEAGDEGLGLEEPSETRETLNSRGGVAAAPPRRVGRLRQSVAVVCEAGDDAEGGSEKATDGSTRKRSLVSFSSSDTASKDSAASSPVRLGSILGRSKLGGGPSLKGLIQKAMFGEEVKSVGSDTASATGDAPAGDVKPAKRTKSAVWKTLASRPSIAPAAPPKVAYHPTFGFEVVTKETPMTLRAQIVHSLTVPLIITVFLFYPAIIRTCVSMLLCEDIVDTNFVRTVLSAQRTVDCTKPHYWLYRSAAVILLVLYGVGAPLLSVVAVLMSHRTVMEGDAISARRAFYFTTSGFRPGVWFWESVTLARKGIIFFLAFSASGGDGQRQYFVAFVTSVFFALNQIVRPFEIPVLMAVESVSLLSIMITANLFMMLSQFPYAQFPEVFGAILIVAFTVNMLALFVFFLTYLKPLYDYAIETPFFVRLFAKSEAETLEETAALRRKINMTQFKCEMAHKRWHKMNENMKVAVEQLLQVQKRLSRVEDEVVDSKRRNTKRLKATGNVGIAQLINQLAVPASESKTEALQAAMEKANESIGSYDSAVAFIITHIEQASTSTDEAYFEKLDGLLLDLFEVEEKLLVQQYELQRLMRSEVGVANAQAAASEAPLAAAEPAGLQLSFEPAAMRSPGPQPQMPPALFSPKLRTSITDVPMSPDVECIDGMRPMLLSPTREMMAPGGGEVEQHNGGDDDDHVPIAAFGHRESVLVDVFELDYDHDVAREEYDGVMP